MAQYYFGDAQSKVRPYVGAGVNYTFFFDEKGGADLDYAKVDVKNSWGIAAQAGIDMAVTDNLFVNSSIWYMNIESDVNVQGLGTVDKTKINPVGLMVGVGYRF